MKRERIFCIILCCCLLLPVLAACGDTGSNDPDKKADGEQPPPDPTPEPPPAEPATIYVLDFADGKTDFLMINTGSPGTDPDTGMEVGKVDGVNALRLTAPGGKSIRLGINVGGLLGDRVTDVRNVVFEVYSDYPDGNFHAVSGRLTAFSGDLSPVADSTWQVYLATRNPNQAILAIGEDTFTAAGPNLIEFACITNGPADRGETPAVIYIKSITFYDSNDTAISLNTNAGWAAPHGYNEMVILGGWILPNPPPLGDPGGWQTWHTPGVDNLPDEHMPWQVVAASFGIVFEMDQPDSFEFVYFGAFNGWSWTQINIVDMWEDGKITVLWEDIGFDTSLVTEDNDGVKLAMGNWGQAPVDLIYLLYDEDAVS